MKSILPRLALALSLTIGPHAAMAKADPDADEAVYRARLEAFLKDPARRTYDPVEPVSGAEAWQSLPGPDRARQSIAAKALEEAERYASLMGSSALLVWHDGRLAARWYAPGIEQATLINSKSLSKPLTAIAIGRALALGKIASLDQSIADFIPRLRGTARQAITIRYLLDMRSGMLDQGFSTDPAHPYNRALLHPEFGSEIIEHYPLPYTPGSRYSYANAPSDTVAMVIEGATGQRYADFLSEQVLRPLGAQGGTLWVGKPGGLAHSGCCSGFPAETYMRLAILLLQDGVWDGKRLLPPGYVAEMRKGTPANPNFGLGIWLGEPYRMRRPFGAPGQPGPQVLHSEPFLDPELFMFDGNSNQQVAISPKYGLIVLRVGETPPPPGNGQPEWDNAFLPNMLIRGIRK